MISFLTNKSIGKSWSEDSLAILKSVKLLIETLTVTLIYGKFMAKIN